MAMRATPRKRLVDRMMLYAMVAAIAASIAGGLQSRGPVRAAGDCTVPASDQTMDSEEQAVLNLINQYRQSKGVGQLSPSASLVRGAAWKARDYGSRAFRGNEDPHTDSTGRSHHQLNLDCGFRGTVTGENLGAGYSSAQAIFDGWKNSPAHNNNMLRANMVAAGVGRSSGQNGNVWALEIGNSLDSGTPTTGGGTTTQVAATPAPTPVTTPRPTTTTTAPAGGTPANTGANTTTNTATTQTVQQAGAVTFRVRLTDAAGRDTAGGLSGFGFALHGTGTFTTPLTDAQGQTTISVPPGVYTLSALSRQGATARGFSIGGAPVSSIAVAPTQTSTLLATFQLDAPAPSTASGGSTTQQLTGGNGGTGAGTAGTSQTGGAGATTTTPAAGNGGSTGSGAGNSTGNAASTPQQSTTTTTARTTATQPVELGPGCTNVALTWAAGTPMSTVVNSLSDSQALIAIWRYSADGDRFRAFAPGTASGVSDYLSTEQGIEAVYICMKNPATLTRPAIG